MPIQIYWKCYKQKKKRIFFREKKSDIPLYIYAEKIDYGYSLEPPWQGGSNEYPHSMFFSKLEK